MTRTEDAPWIVRQLTALLAQRGHAWLLHGAAGLGQYELAIRLAGAWLCQNPSAQGRCGVCNSCHAIEVRTHADLLVLMPETGMLERNWPLGEMAQSELDEKKRKASKEIRVDAMRDAIEFSQRTSAWGRGKVVLVFPAERMNVVSANALLKTLEEPPGDVKFVLASEAARQLLPTVRSRCLGHAMHWPSSAEAVAWMAQQGVDPGAAITWLRAAGGRPGDAVRLSMGGRDPGLWAALPRAVQAGDIAAVYGWAPVDVLDAMQKICHDMVSRCVAAPPRFFDAADLPQPGTLVALSQWGRELARAARTVEHPFNPGLMVEALVSQARNALNSRN